MAPNKADKVTVPNNFRSEVVIRWGDPVLRGTPAFDVNAQTEEKAKKQFGYNCDYVGVLPLRGDTFLLVVNHEYTDENLMFPTGMYDPEEVKRIAMASHGMSVVKIRRDGTDGAYRVADRANPYNRRLHTQSEFRVVGPAAGDDRLKTSADPSGRRVLGTLNNCAGGLTPWGTVLSGEENFNQYFERSGTSPAEYEASYARYGINGSSARGWASVDPRFDLSQEPNEPFRFGWIVELDPYDKDALPRKHTMLGRLKHEGANMALTDDGRAVAYMGDDERNDYIYKFVSSKKMDRRRTRAAKRHNMSLLTQGTLYVARFTDEAEDAAPEYDGVGPLDPAVHRHRVLRRRHVRGRRPHRHPPRGRQGLAHPDGPSRGRPGQPRQRQGLLRPDQQLDTRHDVPDRRGQPGGDQPGARGSRRAADRRLGQPQRLRPGDDTRSRRPRVGPVPVDPDARLR